MIITWVNFLNIYVSFCILMCFLSANLVHFVQLFGSEIVNAYPGFQVLENKVNCNCIRASVWDNNICILHRGLYKLIITRLNESIILHQHVLDSSAAFIYVTLDSARESDVIIGHHKDFKVHNISESFFIQRHNSLENQDRLSVHQRLFANNSKPQFQSKMI